MSRENKKIKEIHKWVKKNHLSAWCLVYNSSFSVSVVAMTDWICLLPESRSPNRQFEYIIFIIFTHYPSYHFRLWWPCIFGIGPKTLGISSQRIINKVSLNVSIVLVRTRLLETKIWELYRLRPPSSIYAFFEKDRNVRSALFFPMLPRERRLTVWCDAFQNAYGQVSFTLIGDDQALSFFQVSNDGTVTVRSSITQGNQDSYTVNTSCLATSVAFVHLFTTATMVVSLRFPSVSVSLH